MQRAYSALHVKQVSEDAGVVRIKGIASTPRSDRDGDVVNPMGRVSRRPCRCCCNTGTTSPSAR